MTTRKKSRSAQAPSMVARLSQTAIRRPIHMLGAAAICAFAAAISLNALAFQTRSHPAPLFRSAPEPVARPSAPAIANNASAPVRAAPVARPASDAAAILPPARPASLADLANAALNEPAPVASRPRDPIADIIRSGRVEAGQMAAQATGPVASAQRALGKLGYGPLKDDGVFGTGTRQAIEQFERDRNWPVTGELNAKVIRELAASTGIAIQ